MSDTFHKEEHAEDITADPKQVTKSKKAEKKKKIERIQHLKDLRDICNTPQGERFFRKFLKEAGLFSQPARSRDADTYFACGEMNTGLRLLADLDEALTPEMMGRLLFRKVGNEVDESE